jgi:hypothetical protein
VLHQSPKIGTFQNIRKVGNNAYKLNLPSYMCINSIVNIATLKFYEPSMPDEDEEGQVLLSIEYLAQDAYTRLPEEITLKKKIKMTRRGQQELWQGVLKG